VNLLLALHCPMIYQYWHELAERCDTNARRHEKGVRRRLLNPGHTPPSCADQGGARLCLEIAWPKGWRKGESGVNHTDTPAVR
jgi:hypothetical protein